jgi:hypothetical protein
LLNVRGSKEAGSRDVGHINLWLYYGKVQRSPVTFDDFKRLQSVAASPMLIVKHPVTRLTSPLI